MQQKQVIYIIEDTEEIATLISIYLEKANFLPKIFFTAEQAWMYSEAANDMVPVIIESDEDISIYDESTAEVIDLQFKVTMSINE